MEYFRVILALGMFQQQEAVTKGNSQHGILPGVDHQSSLFLQTCTLKKISGNGMNVYCYIYYVLCFRYNQMRTLSVYCICHFYCVGQQVKAISLTICPRLNTEEAENPVILYRGLL